MTLSTIERVFLLQGAGLFHQVPIRDLVVIAELCQEVTFRSGEYLLHQGREGDCLYILAAGQVSVVMEGRGQIAVNKQGDMIGELAIISNRLHTASCIALTDITALALSRDDFWVLLEENPSVAVGVLKMIVQRLVENTQPVQNAR